jgi:quercetin dioxygenase-like cupin family protein
LIYTLLSLRKKKTKKGSGSKMKEFEIYETPDGLARFSFSHSDQNFTTGVLTLSPGARLPVHNRPGGFENLTQIYGKCEILLFDEQNDSEPVRTLELNVNDTLVMNRGRWHIHANPSDEISITLFKLVGDITEIMSKLRVSNKQVNQNLNFDSKVLK